MKKFSRKEISFYYKIPTSTIKNYTLINSRKEKGEMTKSEVFISSWHLCFDIFLLFIYDRFSHIFFIFQLFIKKSN